jgi:hypothetical protein
VRQQRWSLVEVYAAVDGRRLHRRDGALREGDFNPLPEGPTLAFPNALKVVRFAV